MLLHVHAHMHACMCAHQEEQLQVALMDYLRKQHPDDHEKMQMVSLKFGMFRELAKTTEEQAKKDLHRIRSKHLCKLSSDLWKCMYM